MKQRMGRKIAGLISVLILGASSGYAQGLINTVAGSSWAFPATPINPATGAPLGGIPAVAVDAAGNVYVCDNSNRRVFKITAAGSLTVVAGNGTFGFTGDGGPATAATLSFPLGVAVDTANPPNVYIADALNHVIRKVNTSVNPPTISTVAGTGIAGFSALEDGGPATSAKLNFPSGVAVDATGNIYIADKNNNRIRKVTGVTISTVAGNGIPGFADNATATSGQLNQPNGVALDAAGALLYVADTLNNRIRKVAAGALSTVAGTGTAGSAGDGGLATIALLNNPLGVWVAGADIYVADTFSGRVRRFTDGGNITAFAGSGAFSFAGDAGPATVAALASPSGVAVSGATVYIADADNKRVRSVIGGTINTFAGNGNFKFAGDNGAATSASLNFPNSVAAQVDASNNITLYIADTGNHRIRKVSSSGTITTIAGTGQFGFAGDLGAASLARLNSPSGVALDASGNSLYIADTFNHRVRRVDLLANPPTINTVVGNGNAGFIDNTTAINGELNQPTAVALDALGNLYIADKNNHRIRKVTAGILSTVAGDGFTTTLNQPTGVTVAVDPGTGTTSIFIADTSNHRIRKLTGTTLSTVAGSDTPPLTAGFQDGTAATAKFNNPTGVAVDLAGNAYIADRDNHRVRKITGAAVSTVAGNGIFDVTGDGGPATTASLGGPIGVALNVLGNLYIADAGNDRVRKLFAGNVVAGSVQGRPGDTVTIPVILSLFGGATVDSLGFGLKVIANAGPPPAVSGALSFTSSIAAPSVNAPGAAGSGEIIVAWNNLAPLAGTVTLGQVSVPIPAGAADAQTYTIQITGASASLAGAKVALDPGVNAALTVAVGSYLVGDAFPLKVILNADGDRDDAAEFGDGVLDILDLIEALRASLTLVTPPPACSDRFDAMDSDPAANDLDADPNTRGGNGSLAGTQDLIVTLRRALINTTERPRRSSRAITPCP